MGVGPSSYYDWVKRPAQVISADELHLYRRAKALFKASRESLGSRELCKKLSKEGFSIGRERTRTLMRKLGLEVKQRIAYKVTTQSKAGNQVTANLLNQNFNPVAENEVWAGDITYLRTDEGWMYLAVVMDVYSRRIVGWHIDKRMTTDLIYRALSKAYVLRKPVGGCVFHSDRGSQYTSKGFQKLITRLKMRSSMGDVGACWDNAVVERFFGSLKHDWILKVHQSTREHIKKDVADYMKYYNVDRLHSANNDMSPVEYENLPIKVSGNG